LRPGRSLTRRQLTLTAAATATQAFDESGNGGCGSYRQARQRFGCQNAEVAATQALNSHGLLGTHAALGRCLIRTSWPLLRRRYSSGTLYRLQ
jgi:hypothetical protein